MLFRPSEIGLPYLGVIEDIVSSIGLCDLTFYAALYNNMVLTGGNAKLPHY
eukprot:CAMPEP_0171299764 /NCGR_PEP_ID=MMETSP0816-20121228/8630_1 /TAXON_ID=420281 /ORGANISM="Proboscia inermis, Strain CCAP1064/1" /LENGTH=50 /DNA_ID=CAMNT_0011775841 /DNA_START=466 /DNA_END=615 /DNA_ORIENTATION=-